MKLIRTFLGIAALALSATQLTACALSPPGDALTAQLPPSPAAAADSTTLDERAALTAEIAYQAGATALVAAIDAGWLDEAAQHRAFKAERTAWQALQMMRAAYDAGNAANFAVALDEARRALTIFTTTTLKGNPATGDTS